MGRGSAAASQTNRDGGLMLECESEGLSEAQLSKLRKIADDFNRLQILLQNPIEQNDVGDGKNAGSSGGISLVNGPTTSAVAPVGTAVTQSLTNGTGMVGLQVPQFLLLQNGQMIAASAAIPTTDQSTTITQTQADGFVATSSQGVAAITNPITKTTASRTSSRLSILNSSSRRTASSATSSKNQNKNSKNNSSDVPEIEILHDVRVPNSNSLRDVRVPRTGPNTQTTTSGSGEVLSANTTSGNSSQTSSNIKNFPLLNVITRPKNVLTPAEAMLHRKDLDAKVKAVLVRSPQEFVEWLLSEGLIRTIQYCTLHHMQVPIKLRLGMFSDPKVLATSGGYVWISECCGKKYVSVYSGSIFGSTPIDKVPPTSVLKLVYHWACQTSISNVESWVKVDRNFINKMYGYLRCVCSVMLQDKVYDFGFDGTTVELGIVSLGTSTADGTKKAVKVEILGLYDRKMKSFRLFASEPEPGSSSRQRFVRILKPLERVVHTNAIILCDQSVDRNCLYSMNYGKVSVCDTSDNEDNLSSNAKIMSYLRRHVPKMFQSALSQLTLQQVQLVLDELCWRERYGNCAAHSYNHMVEHIQYLTAREAENPGVLHLLEFVAQEPHQTWRYKSQQLPKCPTAIQPSIITNLPSNAALASQITLDNNPVTQTPLDHTNKVNLNVKKIGGLTVVTPVVDGSFSVTSSGKTKLPIPQLSSHATSTSLGSPVELEPYYYGQIQGDTSLGREINTHTFTCHICSTVCENNVEFYTHLKLHLNRGAAAENTFACNYCLAHFPDEVQREHHQKTTHQDSDSRYSWCRICNENFTVDINLINHMGKRHYEAELPYRCEVCNFTTSFYYSVIDHFNKEHKNTPYVQCHFCLTVKSINATSTSTFSQRLFSHVQKHNTLAGKCKSCVLSFYSKYLLDEHKKRDHITRASFPGLQRYKIPQGEMKIMFRPSLKPSRIVPGNKKKITSMDLFHNNRTLATVAMSSTIACQERLVVNNEEEEKSCYCIECDASLYLEGHFKAYLKCTKCPYSTCCRNMISKHANVFHPRKNARGYYSIGPPIHLPRPLYCICGFNTRSGNHLARHLALCEGGRKSAYPSVLDAMVYHGDPITGGALSLANLGLASLIPGTSTSDVGEGIDMSHFMDISMDVDDS
ncbi:hypothetical protein Pcinc_016890 [Petrolisthes cinctipes]|uniref:C2H2-type domain-containing protein n=1 Tax=Petrolisthes cinctipes TaxID=88211 RepID=A0AAE1FRF7_PETCI|nr:hypothetical protein Pcinc_016890 [Petrolisthes cinctipes]